MRQLKFRVWSEGYKKYLEDFQFPNGHSGLWLAMDGKLNRITSSSDIDGYSNIDYDENAFSDCVIEQYTNSHDGEGKEIFDGDILEAPSGNRYTVKWLDREMRWVMFHYEKFYYNINSGVLRVVGNIHETPLANRM